MDRNNKEPRILLDKLLCEGSTGVKLVIKEPDSFEVVAIYFGMIKIEYTDQIRGTSMVITREGNIEETHYVNWISFGVSHVRAEF